VNFENLTLSYMPNHVNESWVQCYQGSTTTTTEKTEIEIKCNEAVYATRFMLDLEANVCELQIYGGI